MPHDYALAIYRGDSYTWRFLLWMDAGRTQPMDLTGVDVAAAISFKSGLIPLDCAVTGNQIDVSLTATKSRSLTVNAASAWDLQLTYPSGDVRTVVAGAVLIRADVTGSIVLAGGFQHGAA